MQQGKTKKVGYFYFGGLASMGAVMFTHPLDLIKVHLQNQKSNAGMLKLFTNVVRDNRITGLYNGLSASLLRQGTYSLTRFAIYELVKQRLTEGSHKPLPFYQKICLAGFSGFVGGVVGNPGDMVNVRMQNDMRLPVDERRNYKHVFDGLYRVVRNEGPLKVFNGVSMTAVRGLFVTIGQISFYDQTKEFLLNTGYFSDNTVTHLTSSFFAGVVATSICQPIDVMKTRMMTSNYSSIVACFKDVATEGPRGFVKGFVPAFVRIGPHTILLFIFYEQLVKYFGKTVVA